MALVLAPLRERWPLNRWLSGAVRPVARGRRLATLAAGAALVPVGVLLLIGAARVAAWSGTPMGRGPLTDPWQGASLAVALLAVAAAWVGWEWDPARGRRRCGGCWYEMAGVPGLRCPECGREAKGEGELLRTRRSRGLIALACVLLLVSYSVMKVTAVRAHGAFAAVPTTVLIAAMEWMPADLIHPSAAPMRTGPVLRSGDPSLLGRVEREEMWGWQRDWLTGRIDRIFESSDDVESVARALALLPASRL